MVDRWNMPHFGDRNTQTTQFWHARKFRDSTSVLKGGICEDIHSGYFAGAFMGRKFKSAPSAKEFERSLEYLLDDLSTTSKSIESQANPNSICGDSIAASDISLPPREIGSPDSNISSVRDGFMIDVTITQKPKRRPRSNIFELLQGSSTRTESDQHMVKTQSLCDVSENERLQPRLEAKQHEMEFESVLDDLHCTIKDLDTFSRENIGISLESLDSVSSVTKSGRVSPLSSTSDVTSTSQSAGELKIYESIFDTSADSYSNSSKSEVNSLKSALYKTDDSIMDNSNNQPLGSLFSGSGSKQSLTTSQSDISGSVTANEKQPIWTYTSPVEKHAPFIGKQMKHPTSSKSEAYKSPLKSDNGRTDKLSWHQDKFQFLPDIASDCKRGLDVTNNTAKINGVHTKEGSSRSYQITDRKPQPITLVEQTLRKGTQGMGVHSVNPPYNAESSHQQSFHLSDSRNQPHSIDLEKYTIKPHQKSQTGQSSAPPVYNGNDHEPNSDSIMSSVTDLSGIASEVGYIADMDESTVTETPDCNASWLDAAIQQDGMGECFMQRGFRPLNFVGLESKYMISPIKASELRIPTPVKLRKETGTQTFGNDLEITPESNCRDLSRKGNEGRQVVLESACTGTQTENSLHCSCGRLLNLPLTPTESQTQSFSKADEFGQRKSGVPYCSSVEISPLLNGSQLLKTHPLLARTNSLDTGLSSEAKNKPSSVVTKKNLTSSISLNEASVLSHNINGSAVKIPERTSHLEVVKNEQCPLIQGSLDTSSVKQPEILVTVHNLPSHKQNREEFITKVTDQEHGCRERNDTYLTVHTKSSRSGKCESVPNIRYNQPAESSANSQESRESMRKFASVLIISNINRHLQAQNRKAIKRSSYERYVTLPSKSNFFKANTAGGNPCVFSGQQLPLTDKVKKQTLSNNHKKMMSYTF